MARSPMLARRSPAHARRRGRSRLAGAVVALLLLTASPGSAQPVASSDSLLAVADSLAEAGDFAGAERHAREALARREADLGPVHPDVLDAVEEVAWLLVDQGRNAEASELFERLVAGRTEVLGPEAPAVADALTALATVLYYRGRYARARVLSAQAVAILEAAPEVEPMSLAYALNSQALLTFTEGGFTEARGLYERVLEITRRERGEGHREAAIVLSNLAPVVHQLGDYAGARELYEQALAIDTALQDSLAMGVDLDRLGFLLVDQGDLAAGREHYERALQMKEAVLPSGDPRLAGTLHNLAGVLVKQGQRVEARALFERALTAIQRLGPDHPGVARNLRRLALLDAAGGDRDEAQGKLLRALEIQERQLGPGHPNVAETLADLGAVMLESGDPSQADSLFGRAVEVWEQSLGRDHPSLVRGLNGQARVAIREGAPADAALLRAGRVVDRHTQQILPSLAFAEQQAFLTTDVPRQTALLLSTLRDGAALAEAYALVAGWKGLLLHELRRQGAITNLLTAPEHAEDVQQLQTLRADLAGWYRRSGAVPQTVWQQRADSLTTVKERLERELARALPEGALDDPWRAQGLAGLRAALPEHTAFVDLYRHGLHRGGDATGARYSAVVIAHGAEPVLVDLGDADSLDLTAGRWRDDILDGRTTGSTVEPLTDALWGTLAEALPATVGRVWVSPDGQLARLPWAVLAEGHPRTQRLLIGEVPSARMLLRLLEDEAISEGPESEPTVLLVGDVDFGDATAGSSGAVWGPLPGTEAEVREIAGLAQGEGLAPLVMTRGAPEPAAVVEALRTARYAHLATHGFFSRESPVAYAARAGFEVEDEERPIVEDTVLVRNPLVESGLALAGANAGPEGLLTAEVLVGLELPGTRLVVLSACDTGRGAEVTGQGVLGLRASVLAAGTEALVMSLWPVPDAPTALLMERFYRGIWAEALTPAEALKEAQAAVRAIPQYEAPVNWAAWTISGRAW